MKRTEVATTVIVVSYNSAAVIGQMLRSVPEETPVIVVDNASTDDTCLVSKAARPSVKIIKLPVNQGFGRACNTGAQCAQTPFLFFVNPDAVLTPDTIAALEAAARRLPQFAAANPRILDGAGRSRLKTSSPLDIPALPKPDIDKTSEVAVLSGSAIFVTSKAFHAVGGFDPGIFLYHEDHDLAVRLARKEGRLWHIPDAIITHIAGTGTERSSQTAAFKGYHMARSRIYVLSKSGHKNEVWKMLARAASGLFLPHILFSGRRRAKHLGQIRGAWSARHDQGNYTAEIVAPIS